MESDLFFPITGGAGEFGGGNRVGLEGGQAPGAGAES